MNYQIHEVGTYGNSNIGNGLPSSNVMAQGNRVSYWTQYPMKANMAIRPCLISAWRNHPIVRSWLPRDRNRQVQEDPNNQWPGWSFCSSLSDHPTRNGYHQAWVCGHQKLETTILPGQAHNFLPWSLSDANLAFYFWADPYLYSRAQNIMVCPKGAPENNNENRGNFFWHFQQFLAIFSNF